VAPDAVVAEYGADTLRLYILSAAPPEMPLEWSAAGIAGPHRFLHRVHKIVTRHAEALRGVSPFTSRPLPETAQLVRRRVHQAIQRVTTDIDERLHLNTAVASFNILLNELESLEPKLGSDEASRSVWREALETLLLLLAPFTPHICEELWSTLCQERGSIVDAAWPKADAEAAREEAVELGVQVNGRVRARIVTTPDADEASVRAQALAHPKVREQIDGKHVVRVVVVPGRLVNVVIQ
jgi:leucyl-tRNA synthetase